MDRQFCHFRIGVQWSQEITYEGPDSVTHITIRIRSPMQSAGLLHLLLCLNGVVSSWPTPLCNHFGVSTCLKRQCYHAALHTRCQVYRRDACFSVSAVSAISLSCVGSCHHMQNWKTTPNYFEIQLLYFLFNYYFL